MDVCQESLRAEGGEGSLLLLLGILGRAWAYHLVGLPGRSMKEDSLEALGIVWSPDTGVGRLTSSMLPGCLRARKMAGEGWLHVPFSRK